MDTKFSVAVHILILISEAPKALTSDQMAQSAGTNASYIRKILALLKRAGIVEGHRGVGGYVLIFWIFIRTPAIGALSAAISNRYWRECLKRWKQPLPVRLRRKRLPIA